MPEKRDYTKYQQGVIRRYYANQDGIREQALADLVSDLYLATTDKKRDALWKRAATLLAALGMPAASIDSLVAAHDAKALAAVAAKGFAREARTEWKTDERDSRSE